MGMQLDNRNLCVISVLTVIGLYYYNKINLTPPKDFCIKTSPPAEYTICTWDTRRDKVISGEIHRTGQLKASMTQKLYNVLIQTKRIAFIDIGANIGYFSLMAASLGHPVFAVEPLVLNTHKLKESISKNNFKDNITIFNHAVSNDRRTIRVRMPLDYYQGASRIVDEKITGSDVYISTTIPLDHFLKYLKYIRTKEVGIKIATEGHECKVLQTSDKIFRYFKVSFISLEWDVMKRFQNDVGTACPPREIEEMVQNLTKRGFVPYSYTDNLPLDPLEHRNWPDVNIFWTRRTTATKT